MFLLKEVFEKSIQVRFLRKHRFTQTQCQVEFDVYDFCFVAANMLISFLPSFIKKMHTHPTQTLLLLDESTQITNFADRAIKVWLLAIYLYSLFPLHPSIPFKSLFDNRRQPNFKARSKISLESIGATEGSHSGGGSIRHLK